MMFKIFAFKKLPSGRLAKAPALSNNLNPRMIGAKTKKMLSVIESPKTLKTVERNEDSQLS